MSDTITDYKNPKKVRLTIACLFLPSYFADDDQGVIGRARDVLEKHNLILDVFPMQTVKTAWNTLQYTDPIPDKTEAYTKVYKAAKEKLKQMGCPHIIPLPVIFGQYECSGYGIAPKVTGQLTRLCMISPTVNTDKMTLIHELGHAAELNHDLKDGPPTNFMHVAGDGSFRRTVMYKYQVEALAKAPFSVA